MSAENANKDETLVKAKFSTKIKRLAGKISFLQDAAALYYCALDPRTEKWVKALAFSALAYFIIPLDALPDYLPLVGYTDDAGIILAALKKLADKVTDEHRAKAKAFLDTE